MRWALLRPLRLCVIVCLTPRAANAVMKTAAFAAEEHERKASGTRTGTGPVGRDGHGGRPHHRHGCVSRSERDDARHRLGGAGLPGLGGGRRTFSIWRIDHRRIGRGDARSRRGVRLPQARPGTRVGVSLRLDEQPCRQALLDCHDRRRLSHLPGLLCACASHAHLHPALACAIYHPCFRLRAHVGAARGHRRHRVHELYQLSRRAVGGTSASGADRAQNRRDSRGRGSGFRACGKTAAQRAAAVSVFVSDEPAHRASDRDGGRPVGL